MTFGGRPTAVMEFDYVINGSAITITGYIGAGGVATIPGTIFGLPVTSIGGLAFFGCTGLRGVYFTGNAPRVGSNVFTYDTAVVYYLAGTADWGPTLGGCPSVLWNPQMQTSASFGGRTNEFGFTITGTANIPIVVEASTDLASASWTSLQTCTLTNGSIYFSDPHRTNYPARFYRMRSP